MHWSDASCYHHAKGTHSEMSLLANLVVPWRYLQKYISLLCVLLRWLGWDRPSMSIEHNSYTWVVSAEYVCMTCRSHIPPGRSRAGFDRIARWFGLKTLHSKISPVTELWRSPSPWIDDTLQLASYGAIIAYVVYRDGQTWHNQYDPRHGSGEASAWHSVDGVPSCQSTEHTR